MHFCHCFIDLSMQPSPPLPSSFSSSSSSSKRTLTFLLLLVMLLLGSSPFIFLFNVLLLVNVCPTAASANVKPIIAAPQPLSLSSSPYYSFLSNNEDVDDGYHNLLYNRPYTNIQRLTMNNYLHSSGELQEDIDLYSGPVFIIEPEQTNGPNPLLYSNVTSVQITCKVYGYPMPRIEWRLDNITIASSASLHDFSDHHFGSTITTPTQTNSPTQQYSAQLNTVVSLRNDGQTLIIGGQWNQSSSNNNNNNIDQQQQQSTYSVYTLSALHHHNHHLHHRNHQIECLASNQFGSIISRPVYLQQGKCSSFCFFFFV